MEQASLVKMQKVVSSKIELAKAIIKIAICFNDIKLSDTEVTVLAYFIVYGVNQQSKVLLVNAKVCKNIANIKTIMVKLKKLALIYKDDLNGKVYVTKALSFDITPTIAIYLKLENKA